MFARWKVALTLILASSTAALAQGPGSIIHVGFTSGGPGGIHFISPGGVVTPMGAITPDEAQSNAVALDPWDASAWIGGINAGGVVGAGEIRQLQYDGAGTMTSSVLVTTLPVGASSVSGLAFDHEGFLLASSGTGGFRVNPFTGATVMIAGPAVPVGTYNTVVAGPVTGNAYFGVTGGPVGMTGRITMVPRGGGPEVLLGFIMPPSGSGTISGLAVDPGETTLYATSFGAANNSLVAFPLPGGPAVIVGGAPVPALPALNDVEWNNGTGMLVVNKAGADPDDVYIVDPVTGANALLATVYPPPGGAPASLDINDSGFGLKAIPAQIYTAGPFPLCLSLWATPGDLAAIYLIAAAPPGGGPFLLTPPIVFAVGLVGPRGCLAVSLPVPGGIVTPAGPNPTFFLVGLTFSPAAGFSFTPVVPWP